MLTPPTNLIEGAEVNRVVGTIIGLAIPYSLRFITDVEIPVSVWSVVIALFTATAVGIIFGTLPATRAAQLDPVESLKYE